MIERTNIIGFSGSQCGLTDIQSTKLEALLTHLKPVEAHHGGCIGADDIFHGLCSKLEIRVHLHLGCDKNGYMPKTMLYNIPECDKCIVHIYETKPYLDRNKDIVNACDILIACPSGPEELRSGTWSTVRYAKKSKKEIVIIYPDGTYESIF